jgi:hypothetical protein
MKTGTIVAYTQPSLYSNIAQITIEGDDGELYFLACEARLTAHALEATFEGGPVVLGEARVSFEITDYGSLASIGPEE